jgi:hypothetical protein
MKRLLVLAAVSVFSLGLASAAMAVTPQQEKMKTCNADATSKALKGAERKAFMKECLSAKKAEEPKKAEEAKTAKVEEAKPKATQQEKMKACNADAKAKSLKGDERKKFMSDCLKG